MILLRLVGQNSQPHAPAESFVSVRFAVAESDLVTDVTNAGHLGAILAGERGFHATAERDRLLGLDEQSTRADVSADSPGNSIWRGEVHGEDFVKAEFYEVHDESFHS